MSQPGSLPATLGLLLLMVEVGFKDRSRCFRLSKLLTPCHWGRRLGPGILLNRRLRALSNFVEPHVHFLDGLLGLPDLFIQMVKELIFGLHEVAGDFVDGL